MSAGSPAKFRFGQVGRPSLGQRRRSGSRQTCPEAIAEKGPGRLRRIYFSFPNTEQARRVVAELESAGVQRDRMHTIARPDVVSRHHPEAGLGGVGWTVASAGI